MGFQKSGIFIRPSLTNHETHHADDPTALVVNHIATSSNNREDPRESSRSPQPATYDSSTTSPVPSTGDFSPENTSDKSCSNNQDLLNVKEQSLRQRTAQACDKCRERKTKCSGHHPVCTRCTNRGLLCEYTVRASRARTAMRHRTLPSPNPFQVNYPSGGGRPTPAYHSRMGNSQTNAYARPPYNYAMMSFDPSMAPPLSLYMSTSSSSIGQLGSSNNDLDTNYGRHLVRVKKPSDMRRELKGWDLSPLAQSHASYFERQRAMSKTAHSSEALPNSREKDLLNSYDYMEHNSTTNPSLNSTVQAMQLDERTTPHGTSPPMSLPGTAYHQYSTDGTIITSSSSEGLDLSLALTSSVSRCPSGLSTEHEAYEYSEEGTASPGFRVRGYPGNEYAGWDRLGLPQTHLQDISMFITEYEAAIAHYSSPYSDYDKPNMSPSRTMRETPPGGTTGSQVELMRPTPTSPISMDAYSSDALERSAYGSQDGFQNSGLYGLHVHDTAENMYSYSTSPVSDPGNRFEGFKFFK